MEDGTDQGSLFKLFWATVESEAETDKCGVWGHSDLCLEQSVCKRKEDGLWDNPHLGADPEQWKENGVGL